MAAPALDVNWEAIRAHAVLHGIRPTAEHYGIAPGTLTSRSHREGWFKPEPGCVEIVPQTMQPIAVNAAKPHVAARNALESYSGRTRLKLAKATHSAAKTFAKLPGPDIIAQAAQLKAVTDTADKLHGWSKSGDQAALVNITIAPGQASQAPVIDIDGI